MFRPALPTIQRIISAVLDPYAGDGGKGVTVDLLARKHNAKWVIRVGGPNAGHRAFSLFEYAHVFNQVPSGAFSSAELILEKGMYIDPLRFVQELEDLRRIGCSDVLSRLHIHPEAKLVLGCHKLLNRVGELASGCEDGSTGRGCWEATLDTGEDAITFADLFSTDLEQKLAQLLPKKWERLQTLLQKASANGKMYLVDQYYKPERDNCWFDPAFVAKECRRAADVLYPIVAGGRMSSPLDSAIYHERPIIFEGTQGIGLDKDLGTVPNVCPYTTTLDALLHGTSVSIEKLKKALKDVWLSCRIYATRHGPGMFFTEMDAGQQGIGKLKDLGADLIDGDWPLGFRVGWLDLTMLKFAVENTYAILKSVQLHKKVPILLAISCLDRLDGFKEVKICTHYEYVDTSHFAALKAAGVSVAKKTVKETETGESREVLVIDQFHRALSENQEFRSNLVPVYETFEGWDIGSAGFHEMALERTCRAKLPWQIQKVLDRIEEILVHAKVESVGVGPEHQMRFFI